MRALHRLVAPLIVLSLLTGVAEANRRTHRRAANDPRSAIANGRRADGRPNHTGAFDNRLGRLGNLEATAADRPQFTMDQPEPGRIGPVSKTRRTVGKILASLGIAAAALLGAPAGADGLEYVHLMNAADDIRTTATHELRPMTLKEARQHNALRAQASAKLSEASGPAVGAAVVGGGLLVGGFLTAKVPTLKPKDAE
jgi:hypothetical protein